MTNELISVIMPAYNAEKYIEQAIKSLQDQTYSNWELVIVDDGSTDETLSIVKKIVDVDNRVKVLSQARGQQGKARNLGIKNSTGNYVAFLDADDLWISSKLQTQLDLIQSRPDVDLLFTCGYTLLPDGSTLDMNIVVKNWNWANDRDTFINANQIPALSVMVRRQAIEAVKLFCEQPDIQSGAEDYHLWIKLLKNGKFLSIADKLFYYRIHPMQVSAPNNNTSIAIANCFFELVSSGILDKSMAVKNRLKWLIFPNPDTKSYLNKLKVVFPEKKTALSLFLLLNKLLPDSTIVKKMVFHSL